MRSIITLAALALALALPNRSASAAAPYPVTVADVAGRQVEIKQAPRRIYLQEGNHIQDFAILEREQPFARLLAWNNNLGASDPTIWALMLERWPDAERLPTFEFNSSGNADIEALIRLQPDLLIMDLKTRGAIERGPVARIMARLDIPILYVDNSLDPLNNGPRSLLALGAALDQRQRAQAYVAFHEALRERIARGAAASALRPRVFIEARAGRAGLDQCCYSQGETSWGKLIGQTGAVNYASSLLSGATGDIALETLIRDKPDVYLMTGTARVRRGAHVIPFGYGATSAAATNAMAALMARPAFEHVATEPGACVAGLYHQFYNSVFNAVGMAYLARILYPDTLGDLDADSLYRQALETYTDIPTSPFLFDARHRYDGVSTNTGPPTACWNRP